ncbi:MAG: hypothetical protein GY802_26175 [Gammaproteobacteria bacterium]|nr:hypothetical protein [Gammaproteobacteria bacterium]MCP4391809.1 hypothetical protein [Gammaproteobacteria bacterium]MCP5093574.1 hypothetical protein [Gammaproteobacteria bacterium]
MTNWNHALPHLTIVSVVFAFALLPPAVGVTGESRLEPVDSARADEHALQLGHRVLAIAAAIRNPDAPGALGAVLELGLDSRYYVMVRGWLAMQLRGDMSIQQARNGDVSPQITARIAFLERAIRAIDLE